jgi:5'-phosphate synthase pdxT subunit
LDIKPLSEPFPAIFIRAPVVEEIYTELENEMQEKEGDEKVEVFSTLEVHTDTEQKNLVVAVRKGAIFGTAFHPELTKDNRLHEWWIKEVVIPSWKEKQSTT